MNMYDIFMMFVLRPEESTLQQGHQQSQIRGILSIASAMFNLTFQQTWIAYFIKLFHSKQQVTTFFDCFNEAYHYSTQQSYMEIEDEKGNDEIQMNSLDIIGLGHNQKQSNSPKQEGNSEMVTNQMSQTQCFSLFQSIIASNPYVKLQSIYQQLKQITSQQTPSMQSIQGMLKSLDYRQVNANKTSIDRNSMISLQNRYKYCFEYHQIIQSKIKVFFMDACKIDMNMGAESVWIKYKQAVSQRTNDDYIQVRACLTQNESLIYDVQKRSKGDTINDAAKVEMIANMIKERHPQENIVIIINSLNIPISTSIKRIVMKHYMRLFILPPLSPQLNPSHFFFRQLKALIRSSASKIRSLGQLQQCLAKLCNQLKENLNYFEYMKDYIIKGLTKTYF